MIRLITSIQSCVLIIASAALFVCSGCDQTAFSAKPTSEQIQVALSQKLRSDFAGRQEVRLTEPTNVRLGNYNSVIKGWPVYADWEVSYKLNGIGMHENSISNVGVPHYYARKTGDTFVCFRPEFAVQMEKAAEEVLTAMQELSAEAGNFQGPNQIDPETQKRLQQKMRDSLKKIEMDKVESHMRNMIRDIKFQ